MNVPLPREYTIESLSVGLLESFEVSITSEMIRGFETISGDHNPLHTDVEFARNLGHPKCVAYGMLTASFYSTLVGMYLPGKYALLLDLNTSFRKPVFADDRLTVIGEVMSISEVVRLIEVKANIRDSGNALVSNATIRVCVNES